MLKIIINNLKDSFKKYFTNHIGTNIILLLIALIIIVIDPNDIAEESIERLFITLFLASLFTLFGESYTKDNKKRYIIYGVGFIISFFMSKCAFKDELNKYLLGIILTLGFSIIYLMINNSKQSTNKYLTSTVTNLLKLGIIGSVLNVGIMSIIGLITTLLIELDEIVFAKTEIILLMLYYVPAFIISLESLEKENTFIYNLINYVALPLISIATTIIYIYILKLLITLEFPHTATFAINTALLTCGIPIVLMVLSYNKKTIMTKIANILKKLYVPLVLLQIFALSLRIKDYSITTSRYFGIILILLGIISMVLLNKKNGNNYKYIFIPCILLSIISCMVPYINMFEFPNYMQINRLKRLLPEGKEYESLTKEEKENVKSIYYYVSDKKYYPKYLSKNKLENMIENENYYNSDYYIDYNSKNKKIDVKNYKEIEEYSTYEEGFTISINDKDYDLKQFFEKIYNNTKNENVESYIEENNIIHLDSDIDLLIVRLHSRYLDEYVSIEGYILYK